MSALPQEIVDPHYTYADYKEWELDEGERYEVMNGEVYEMAAPNTIHQVISREISRQLFDFLYKKPCQAFAAPFDVRLFYEEDESDDTVVQPDLVVICDKEKIGPEGCRGAPNLVIEILSPSNTAIEMQLKFDLYREAGVLEYWVVDPQRKFVTVYCFRKDFIETKVYRNSDNVPVSVLPGLAISLKQVFEEK